MKYHEMTKNYIFREFVCGLTQEQTANLCFKSVRTVKLWDKGKPIPPECKRLMRMVKGREISSSTEWTNFRMHYDRLELPTGQLVSSQQIITGIALLQIGAESDIHVMTKLLKFSRMISDIK